MPIYFIQMSGVPGSGKSSIARGIASQLTAVILDHDETKSAILRSGVSESQAGAASYEVIKALSKRLLEQATSVIVDSPCLYQELLDHGMRAAQEYNARYKYIECQLNDLSELDKRLRSRKALTSQILHLDQQFSHAGAAKRRAMDLIVEWAEQAKRPQQDALVLDTARPIADCVLEALTYIDTNIDEEIRNDA